MKPKPTTILLHALSQLRKRPAEWQSLLLRGLSADATSTTDLEWCAEWWPQLPALLKQGTILEQATAELSRWQERGIGAISLLDSEYPELLREIPDPPAVLFYRGALPKQFATTPFLSVVGSRSPEPEALELARSWSSSLANYGATIVSGLALGIDTAAHRGALASDHSSCPTVAVLGSGLDALYPRANYGLAQEIIARGGCVLSQFPAEERPYPFNFLNRNRVIAGLSAATVVVQAGAQSGSLVTARHVAEYGRELFVPPGRALDERYRGSHRLIREGATLVCSLAEIHEGLPVQLASRLRDEVTTDNRLTTEQQRVHNALSSTAPITVEEIAAKLATGPARRVEYSALVTLLSELEELGKIRALPGNQYLRIGAE